MFSMPVFRFILSHWLVKFHVRFIYLVCRERPATYFRLDTAFLPSIFEASLGPRARIHSLYISWWTQHTVAFARRHSSILCNLEPTAAMSDYSRMQEHDTSLLYVDDAGRYPTSPRPRPRQRSHASNPSVQPSWNSAFFPPPNPAFLTPQTPMPTYMPVQSPPPSQGRSVSTSQQPSSQVMEPVSVQTPEEYYQEPHSFQYQDQEQEPRYQDQEQEYQDQEYTEQSAEHMDFSAGDIEAGQQQKGKKGFVGGFVTQLKNLPRAITRNPLRERKTLRKGFTVPYNLDDPAPRYEDPGQPGPSNVQIVQGMEMPSEQPMSDPVSYADPNDEQFTDVHLDNPHSEEHIPSHNGIPGPAPLGSPVPVEPRPTADYAKMESPVRTAPPDDSFSAHITRIHNFLVDLKNLPWFSPRVTIDYYPEKSPRARDPKVKSGSWYTTREHQHLDLLETPATRKAEIPRSYDDHSLRRPRTPSALSHGESSCPSARRQRRHTGSSRSHAMSSPVSSHGRRQSHFSNNSAQPVFLFPSPVGSPHLPHISSLNGALMGDLDGKSPIQMYMVPAGSPMMMRHLSPPPVSHPATAIQFSSMSSAGPLSNAGDTSMAKS